MGKFIITISLIIFISKYDNSIIMVKCVSCNYNVESLCANHRISKSNCDNLGCCFKEIYAESNGYCFHATCISGCETCENSEYCIACKSGYYPTEDNRNCFQGEVDNYYLDLDTNKYKSCHPNCVRCSSSENKNCIKCKTNFYLTEDSKLCLNKGIDYYYLNNNKLKRCHPKCVKCNSAPINDNFMNCNTCLPNYYLTEDTKSCYKEILDNYYLDNNILRRCHSNCKTCNSGYTEKNMNCILCKQNFYKLIGTNNCYNRASLVEGFYFKENMFYPCNENCLTCSDGKNDTSNNCLTCDNENKGLYLLEDLNNCEYSNYSGYYLDNNDLILKRCFNTCKSCNGTFEIHNNTNEENHNCVECADNFYKLDNGSYPYNCYDNETINSWKIKKHICYYTCMICDEGPMINNETGNIISHNCKQCLEGYNFLFKTKDCYNNSITEYGYYLSSNDSNYHKCGNQCQTCINETICIKCNIKNNYYFIYNEELNNCYNNETIKEGYYLDKKEDPYKWKKCYEKCETCTTEGNSTNMNCLSCNSNLINYKTLKPYYFKLAENGNCIEGCSDNLYLTLLGDCLDTCPNGTYKYSMNYTCLKSCPHNYELNKEQNECIKKSFDQTTSSSEFKNEIMNNILEFVNSSKIINGSDFLAVVLSSDDMDPKEQLKKGISAIDLGDCPETIKKYYNISEDESLIILNMESKKNESKIHEVKDNNDNSFDLGKNVQVEVFDMYGRKLDLSVCKEDIKVMKYIGDVEELDIESAMGLADQGIDVFNASDSFFNDICQDYNNTDGKDIVIKDRRSDVYQNVSFCQKGCAYDGMNYELMTANCICDSSILQIDMENKTENSDKNREEEQPNFNTLTKSIIANLFDFNFDVFSCYNLVFNLKILVYNIGFYCMSLMFILQIIFFLIYISKRLQPIKYFMLIFNNQNQKSLHSFPPRKNNNSNSIIEILDSQNIDQNKNIKSKFFSIKKKENEKKLKYKEKINIIEEDDYNESDYNSKRKLGFMNDIGNLENIFERKNKDLENLNEFYSKIKPNKNIKNDRNNNIYSLKGKRKIVFTNNFVPTVNIQTPVLNINSKKLKQKNKASKMNKKFKKNEAKIENKKDEEKMYSKNLTSEVNFKKRKNIKKGSASKNIKNKNKLGYKNKIICNQETIEGKVKSKKNQNIIKMSNNDEDLQDMNYELAIIHDKRSFLRIYWSFLVDSQIILGTFCTDNYLNLLVIKLSFLVYTFQISFFLNAFFYTDEYISDAYHNDGILDFVSGLPKSIYSFVATLITTNILRMLSNSKSELMRIIREKRRDKNYIYLIDIKLRKLRIKLIIYFLLVFSLGLLFLYYVSAFCAVYRNSQIYWFIGCLESFGIDSFVAVAICFLLTLFRYIAIKKRIKCFYILANIISTFL